MASNTQNQALNALVFLYRHVIEQPLQEINGVTRAKKPQKLPAVLTSIEVSKPLSNLKGVYWLIACLQYGAGLRLIESVRLRIIEIDFDHRVLYVRNGKGAKDRVVTLADELVEPLKRHLQVVQTLHERTWQVVLVRSICPMHSPVNIPMLPRSGDGSTYFPLGVEALIPVLK